MKNKLTNKQINYIACPAMSDDDRSFWDVKIGLLKLSFIAVIYVLDIASVGSCKQEKCRINKGRILWELHQETVERLCIAETSVLPIADLLGRFY